VAECSALTQLLGDALECMDPALPPGHRVVRMSDAVLAVIDCFRFRNKIGLDVALEALRDGWTQRKFTPDDLWRHATRGRVANVKRPCIEAITA
jgi:hypothetical protein